MPQLELFKKTGHEHLYSYWRYSLHQAVNEIYVYRNNVTTTGYSYALGGIDFAWYLFSDGQLDQEEYERYERFFKFAGQHYHTRLERLTREIERERLQN